MEGNPVHPVAAGTALGLDTASGEPAGAGTVRAAVLPARLVQTLRVVAVLAAVATAVALLLDARRTSAGILVASQYLLGMGVGGLLFVALGYVLSSGWHIVIRRVPEALAGLLPIAAVGTLISVACVGALYEWSHASHVEGDAILEGKAAWLNVPAFVLRSVAFLAVWILFAWLLRRNSLSQDRTADVELTRRNTRLSALLLVVFGLTFTLGSVDWLMSLEPHWYSTVFAIYNFAGLFSGALAAMLVVLIALRRMGRLPALRDDHLHDLGKLTLGFATFWAYIWFCQYMLIWYSHIPEETVWYAHRQVGGWSVIHLVNPIINWLIPFLALLPRPAKRRESTLLLVAALLLVGRWVDLYYIVAPVALPEGPAFGFQELAPMALACAVGVLGLFRILGRHPLVPRGDPYLVESLHHHL